MATRIWMQTVANTNWITNIECAYSRYLLCHNKLNTVQKNTAYCCVRKAAYQTLLRPQVEYASTIWNPYTKQGIRKAEMVQRRAVRWTLNNHSPHSSVTEMQHELAIGWRSLEQRRLVLYKIINGQVAIPLPYYFQQPTRMTSHSHPLALRQIYTSFNFYKYSFYPLAVVQWHKLPIYVVVLSTLEQFQKGSPVSWPLNAIKQKKHVFNLFLPAFHHFSTF